MTEERTPPPTPSTDLYRPELLAAWRERLSDQALWLLLSLDHYGWRAHADLAHTLLDEIEDWG